MGDTIPALDQSAAIMDLQDEPEGSISPSKAMADLQLNGEHLSPISHGLNSHLGFDRLPSKQEILDELEREFLAPVKDLSSDLHRWQM